MFCFIISLNINSRLAFCETTLESDVFEGIIIDYTMTVWGHRFYKQLSEYMRSDSNPASFDSVKVIELLFQTGSRITVTYDNKVIFQTMVFPGGKFNIQKAKRAAVIIKKQIYNNNMGKLLFHDPDLGIGDF